MVRYYNAENYSLEDWLNQASDDLRMSRIRVSIFKLFKPTF